MKDHFHQSMTAFVKEATAFKDDLEAFLQGKTPPSVQEWQSHVQQIWNDYAFIALAGRVYKLTNKPKKKPNGAYYNPCDLCALSYECGKGERRICDILSAETDEYFYDVGELIINK